MLSSHIGSLYCLLCTYCSLGLIAARNTFDINIATCIIHRGISRSAHFLRMYIEQIDDVDHMCVSILQDGDGEATLNGKKCRKYNANSLAVFRS